MITSGSLEITVKISCPNWCSCCPQSKLVKSYGENRKIFLYEHFRTIIDKLPNEVRVDFSGFCEPFIHPFITQMIGYALKNHTITIYSTLVGLTIEKTKALAKLKIPPIEVHRNNSYFVLNSEKQDHGLRLLATYGVPFKIASFGLHSRAGNVHPKIAKPPHYIYGPITCGICGNAFNRNVILPNGDVYQCCMNYGLTIKLGNLLWQSWDYLHSNENPQYNHLQDLCKVNDSQLICRQCNFVKQIKNKQEK